MIIERLSITDFKQFAKKLDIENLTPGLNVFTGNNEAGKSTIAEAVRTLFLERYSTTSTKEDILPWSKPNASPSIEATFSHNGNTYLLSKQFVTGKRCNLLNGTTRLDGDEAEEHLAEMFGFARSKKGAISADQSGIPGLLWVQQGESHRVAARAAPAAEYLRGALGQLSGGEVVGGEDTLIKAVEKQLLQLRTPSKREAKAKGELDKVEKDVNALLAQRAIWQQQLDMLEFDLGNLTALQGAFDKDERDKPWVDLERRAGEARAKLAEVANAKQLLDSLGQDLKLSTVTLAGHVQKAATADAVEKNLTLNKVKLEGAQADEVEAEVAYTTALEAASAAQAEYDAATAAEKLASAAATAAELREALAALKRELTGQTEALEKANTVLAELEKATAERAKVELDPKKLKKLKSVLDELMPLRAQQEATATRIEYRLNGAVRINDSEIRGRGTLVLDTAKTLKLADESELTIVPGGSDRGSLVEEIAKLEGEAAKLLGAMGVASLTEAENRLEHWKALVAEVSKLKEVLEIHAPEGIDSLKTTLTETTGREEAARIRLAALPDTSDALPVTTATSNTKKAKLWLDAAHLAEKNSAEKRSIARTMVQGLIETVAAAETEVATPAFVQAKLNAGSAMFAETNTNKILKEKVVAAEAEYAKLTLIDPQVEVARFEASARIARDQQDQREKKIIDVRARIQVSGGSGVEENLSRSKDELELLQTRAQQLTLRADALELLNDLLVEERDNAITRLQSPLTKRLEHYLKWLFPQSVMTLSENLAPFTLSRAERFDELSALSYGTQEQLGILTRLAYADLLKEAGRPTVLFFDDAAVHTDAFRRDAIKQALLDAATRHQIFLFTCHPENWNDLGVEQRALEEMKAAA